MRIVWFLALVICQFIGAGVFGFMFAFNKVPVVLLGGALFALSSWALIYNAEIKKKDDNTITEAE